MNLLFRRILNADFAWHERISTEIMRPPCSPRRIIRRAIGLGALIAILCMAGELSLTCLAQGTTSAIAGTVTDSTGASVVGASITIVNTATAIAHHTSTDSNGLYQVTQLPPGSYTMEVASPGFETQNLKPFQLLVDQQTRQNITLSVGTSMQTVSVSASSLLLDTETSNQGQVIENKQIESMPLNGRDFLQLAELSPGVTPIVAGMSTPASAWTGTATVSVAIAGLREDDVSYLYDGIETRNAWYGAEGLLPSVDNIQEFKVEQSGSSSAYGNGAAFINVVTRSGTNTVHGTLYEFVRNNDFDARNYFDVGAPPPFHQNQFGASLGGPIKKNRTFFFANYEGFRQIQPADLYNRVPTNQQIQGDFSSDPNQLVNPFTGASFPGNQIPSSLFSKVGQKVFALYPQANGSYAGGNNYFNVASTANNWDQESARLDYAISSKDNVFARFTNQDQTTTVPQMTYANEKIFPSAPKNLAVGWTHIYSPQIVNNVRFGWSHTATGESRADGYDPSKANPLGLINEEDQPGSYGPPTISVAGYGNPGSWAGTDIVREGLTMGTESLMIQKGKHQITAGLDIRYSPLYMYEDWAATDLIFVGIYSGDPIADLLLGLPYAALTAIGDPTLNFRSWYQSYYVQDNAQLRRNLSVNVGVRWEHNQEPVDTANHVGTFDFATNTDLSYPDTKALGLGRAMVRPHYLNFSPRVGFNWVPFSKGNTDVKGGFGIYFLQPNMNQYETEVDTLKYYQVDIDYNAIPGRPLNFTLDQLFTPNLPGAFPTASFIDPNNKSPYTYEWNLSIEHTLKDWLVGVAYLGSAARHFEVRNDVDAIYPDGTLQYPGWGSLQENQNQGGSTYHGLVARAERRYRAGFSLLGSYTFSKCLSSPWQDMFTAHPFNLNLDRGHCSSDLHHVVTANSIYELPFGRGKAFLNKSELVDALAGGWKASVIAALHSGPYYTLSSYQNVDGDPLPNLTGPINNPSLHSGLGKHGRLGPYFNVNHVQALTATGIQGNSGMQNVMSPGSANWDLSVDKTWKYAERYGLTLRTDIFNAFNRPNFTGLDTAPADGTFGDVTSANAAREIQLSLRFDF